MSFRSDDQRRYGHVPPVQYPVSQPQNESSYPARRPSFNSGDDASFFDQNSAHAHTYPNTDTSAGTEDELFLTSPTSSSVHRPTYSGSTNSALSGHQHQYQAQAQAQAQGQAPPTPTHATYNPQHFTRPQSTSLPYHPPPPQRYSSTSSTASHAPTSPTTYTPAQYNPAAYAAASQPQRQSTLHGYNYGHGYASPSAPQPSPGFSPSPNSPYASAFPQSAQVPVHHDPALPSPGHVSTGSHPSSYDPSHQQSYGNTYATYPNGGASSPVPAPVPYTTATSSAPYPMQSHMPIGPQYLADSSSSIYIRASRSNSLNSQASSIHLHSPGLQRHPTNAPLPSRPMDNVPEEPGWDTDYVRHEHDHARIQDDIIQDIEAELAARIARNRSTSVNGAQASDDELQQLQRYTTTTLDSSNVSRYSSNASTNAQRTHTSSISTFYYEEEEDDDPEGTAGVLAMQQAEMDDRRFSSTATLSYTDLAAARTLPPPPEEQSSDTDYGGTDLGLFSGGYEAPSGTLAYGTDVGSPPMHQTENASRPLPSRPGYYPSTSHESYEAAPAFRDAEVDYGGTGGLQPPTAHRLSFDEGEERVSIHSLQSGSESPQKEDYPDIFYHPGMSIRPLPHFPQAPRSDSNSMLSVQTPGQPSRPYSHGQSLSVDSRHVYSPEAPEGYYTSAGSGSVPPERSISLSSHSNTPQVQAPARSRTDAAEERRKMYRQQQHHHHHHHHHHHLATSHASPYDGYDTDAQSSMAYDMITLPSGRRRKFVPSKLTSADFRKCTEPWALSGIAAWIREMADGEPDLKQKTVEEALVNLFTDRVPTLNVADAEVLSTRVVDIMLEARILLPEEEWVKFGPGSITGVLWQLTGSGCYAPKLHQPDGPGRCYSVHCMRTLKKANLDELMLEEVKAEDWATFYKLTKESVEGRSKKEIERQNVLHEIVTSEEGYMNQLEVLRVLYRDQIRNAPSPIIAPNRVEKFIAVVFGKVDAVQATNKEHLLAQLKYRQQEQGPFITGFSDLFREWIRKARDVYIDYASQYPHASYLVRKEADRNIIFQEFLDRVRNHKRSTRLDWTHFLKAPITRLQRYTFLLQTVEKNMVQDNEEKANLVRAISEIHNVTLECDQKVAEMQKKVEMMELNAMLVLRPGFHSVLNLDHLGRELILQGELQRMGSKGVRWVDTHALLFDHYLILAKPVSTKDGKGGKKFDVSKEPIPMPLLFLDSINDDPISKQKAPLARNAPPALSDTRLNKMTNGNERPSLEHATTGSSIGSVSMNRLTPTMSNDKDKILYPFRVKHLGHETYTLFASSAEKRGDWVRKMIEAKTRHAKALFSQNAEPFRLRVLADSAFAYDSATALTKQLGVPVRGTPLDRAIRELESVYGPGRGPAPVCRAQVNCATGFSAYGKSVIAIGTDYGVYISDSTDPRGWTRTVQVNKVTQITVIEEFSVCLIIADRSLIGYPLDVVAPVSSFPAPIHDSPRRAPQRLGKDVAFFATAKMKDRMLLFYKRREGMHNTFRVLEPVFQKSSEKKRGLFGSRKTGGGVTEYFRDYDEFYLPTECYSLNLFQSYIAVSTARGFELLTLDKKQTMSIPDVREPAIANIANRIRDQRPLGMFRLNDQEFLLAYEDCAVYVDKHGDVSRTLIMEYSGKQKKARAATMYGQYLLLFNEDYVEVRNAENGRLRQIIAGRDVRCLDYGVRGPTGGTSSAANNWVGGQYQGTGQIGEESKGTVKISMSHPEIAGTQIVLELRLNDGHTEK
ncbi:Rho1 guanine nucleotide exchange factor 3 [Sodiomyces alkalinus F11]|uniref:Rho1 guanine nucleotide exchange factor 3 n=1 Tax=Sodiomyces alkalinus (strain CBS 110278 / VKM F-3762 / F11) TaxID=1314773 RepID=A0A3N2PLL0_SODAK|nr:Rho1 guanine nucleotide exchange factor 3 [Sodiomyces alkalinus F11]ROT35369.1 Rho1 guanine nucleotide exchange factor 3 [Sodiomyces alkalinus F11]